MDPSKSFKTRRFRRELDTGERVAAASARRVLEKHLLDTRVEVGIPAGQERLGASDGNGTLEFGGGGSMLGVVPMTRDIAREPLRAPAPTKDRTEALRAKGNTKTHRGQPRPGGVVLSPEVTGEYTKVNEDPKLPLARPLMMRSPFREEADPRMGVGERATRQYTTSEFAAVKGALLPKRVEVVIARPSAAPPAREPRVEPVPAAVVSAAPAEPAVPSTRVVSYAPDVALVSALDRPDAPLDAASPAPLDDGVSPRSLVLFVLALLAATLIVVLLGL